MSLLDAPPAPHHFTPEHVQFRAALRGWVAREIAPQANAWDEAETFPRDLYKKAASIGLLGLGYPEHLGGTPADLFYHLVLSEELARPGCGGVAASLLSHTIGLPPVQRFGSAALQQRVIPPVLAGDKIAVAYAESCFDEALDWARQRQTFGAPLSQRQVIRHKLMDMLRQIDVARCHVCDLAWRVQHSAGDPAQRVARTALAKVQATQCMPFCADAAVQILGGMGLMRGTRSERIYREVKVMMIGGGSEEIMKDLAARQLGS